MRVCAIRDQPLACLFEAFSYRACVCNDLLAVLLKGWCCDLFELDGKATDLVVVRASLEHWEDGKVDLLKQILFAENYARAGTAQTLVRRRGHDIAELEWIVHLLRGDKTANVCDVSHEVGTHTVGNLSITSVIEISGVATGTTEKNIWAELSHSRLKRVHVNDTSLLVYKVWLADKVVARSGYLFGLGLMSMGQVTAVCQRQTHKLGAWLKQARIDSKVCWTAGQWLYVDTPFLSTEAESIKSTLLAESLDLVNDLVAAIVAFAWVALRVLVRQAGSQSLHHGLGSEVLASNQLDTLDLSLALFRNQLGHLRVNR